MNDPNEVSLKEKMAHECYVIKFKEAQRHTQRMRTELNRALGFLDALDQIVEMASDPTLFEEDYLDYTRAAHVALWDAIEATKRASCQWQESNNSLFDVLFIFMDRRWRKLREDRNNETDGWIATAKVHKREANHNRRMGHCRALRLDGYCEGT